ncbi:hypothetical protein [Variovorax sp. J22R115]|uniref:hypothetical protein n=1 Tax=Variovorax sp. J22R115 TaxID=3053509 RepID=UPI002576A97F|nr:hypothetical protein [Variovorax sp. J22R115]MDM0053023.1 hypothetical protein [Variovorax sp. J22R115]
MPSPSAPLEATRSLPSPGKGRGHEDRDDVMRGAENHKVNPQVVWGQLADHAPDYLFLLGDQIYMDFWPHLGEPETWSEEKLEQVMRRKYLTQWEDPGCSALFAQLRSHQDQDGGVYATWDDQDFAWNNANGVDVSMAKKSISRRVFAERWQLDLPQVGDGIDYAVPLWDGGIKIGKAIFLDTRWYREEEGDEQALLSETQFQFLESELAGCTGLTLICGGTPMRAKGNGWVAYRRDYRRFMDILGDRKAIYLTGDIHENAFLPPSSGTKLYEIVCSGAAIVKSKAIGRCQNYAILDVSSDFLTVSLFDRRGSQAFRIALDDSHASNSSKRSRRSTPGRYTDCGMKWIVVERIEHASNRSDGKCLATTTLKRLPTSQQSHSLQCHNGLSRQVAGEYPQRMVSDRPGRIHDAVAVAGHLRIDFGRLEEDTLQGA